MSSSRKEPESTTSRLATFRRKNDGQTLFNLNVVCARQVHERRF